MRNKLFSIILLVSMLASLVGAAVPVTTVEAATINFDNGFSDWDDIHPILSDTGDGLGNPTQDITNIYVTDDDNNYYFRIDSTNIGPQSVLTILIDSDANPSTGYSTDSDNSNYFNQIHGLGINNYIEILNPNSSTPDATLYNVQNSSTWTQSTVASLPCKGTTGTPGIYWVEVSLSKTVVTLASPLHLAFGLHQVGFSGPWDEAPNGAYLPYPVPGSTPPVVSTLLLTETGATTALKGNLDFLGSETSVAVRFEWGTSTSYGSMTDIQTLTEAGQFTANITGLSKNIVYHYRSLIDGTNIKGQDVRFFFSDAPPVPPVVVTSGVVKLAPSCVTLQGQVTSLGTPAGEVSVNFSYWKASAPAMKFTPSVVTPSIISTTPGNFSATITLLDPGTDYVYQAVATASGIGDGQSAPANFTTDAGDGPSIQTPIMESSEDVNPNISQFEVMWLSASLPQFSIMYGTYENHVWGVTYLDTDQNSAQGYTGVECNDIGAEYKIEFQGGTAPSATLFHWTGSAWDAGTPVIIVNYRNPEQIPNMNFEYSFLLPLVAIGGDDGNMNVVQILGQSGLAYTDIAPNADAEVKHGIITPPSAPQNDVSPVVIVNPESQAANTAFILNGQLTVMGTEDDVAATSAEVYFKYGINSGTLEAPETPQTATQNLTHIGPFEALILNLTPGTQYFYKVYVKTYIGSTESQTAWSATGDFTTSAAAAVSGKIAFVSNRPNSNNLGQLYITDPADGAPQINISSNLTKNSLPSFSDDGAKLIYESASAGTDYVYTMYSSGSGQSPLLHSGNPVAGNYPIPAMDPTDPTNLKIAYVYQNNIWLKNGDGTGTPRQVTNSTGAVKYPVWAPGHIYFQMESAGKQGLYYVYIGEGGDPNPTPFKTSVGFNIEHPALSINGMWAFSADYDGNYEIYIADWYGNVLAQLTNTSGAIANNAPAWSPDGNFLTFMSDADGDFDIYTVNINNGTQVKITNNTTVDYEPAWGQGSIDINPFVVTVDPATVITQTSATIHGVLTSRAIISGVETAGHVYFYVSTDSTFSADERVGVGIITTETVLPYEFSATASGLNPSTTYYFCATASGPGFVPESKGATYTFTTQAPPTTGSISGHIYQGEQVGLVGATVEIFGPDVEFGADITDRVGTTSSGVDGNYTFSDLPAGQYGIRVTATGYVTEWYNDEYSGSAADMVTVTAGQETAGINISLLPANQVLTTDATSIGNTGATLNGTLADWVNTTGVTVYFQYWLASDSNNKTRVDSTFSGTGSNIPFSAVANGLTEDTSYVYRAVAEVGAVPTYGNEINFKTTHPWTTIINDSADDNNAPYISTVQTYRGLGKVAFKITGNYLSHLISPGYNLSVYLDTDQNSATGFPFNNIGADYALLAEGFSKHYVGHWNAGSQSWDNIGSIDMSTLINGVIEIPLSDLGNDDGNMYVVAEISNPDYEMIDIAPNSGHGTTTQYTLFIAIPITGSVIVSPVQTSYYAGTQVTLTATPNPGWQFDHWTVNNFDETANPLNLIMDGNKAVSVTFTVTDKVDLELTPASDISVGETFDVQIRAVAGVQEVVGAEVYLDFDPAKLEVVQITAGTALPDEIAGANINGQINYTFGKLGSPYPTGTFTIATIQFRALAETDSTSVTFSDLGDRITTVAGVIAPDVTGTLYDGYYIINNPPTVTIEQAVWQTDPTNTSLISFTVVFSEPVTGFETGDVSVTGTAGATTATVTGTGATYNVVVSGMTSDGTVIVIINAGVATDADASTNTASTSINNTVTYDTTPPTITINAGTTPTNIGTQTITGTMEASATVTLASATATFGTVTYTTTTWSVLATLAAGSNTITATAHDDAGNAANANTAIVLDTTVPTITINPVTTPTNIGTQTITGTMEAGATVTLTGASFGTVTYPTSTTWNVSATLASGSNAITATAHDAAGNAANANTAIVLDTTVPTITINPVTTPTNIGTQTITGTMEAGATVTLTGATFGTVTYPTSTTWNVSATLASGSNAITATAHDAAGNAANANTAIVLDTTVPTITINPVTTPTNIGTQTVTGTMEAGATVTLTGATFDTVTYPTTTNWSVLATLAAGSNSITATAHDAAGNIANANTSIVLDITIPTITINPVTTPTNIGTQTVTGTMEASATVTFASATATFGTVTYTSTTWSVLATLAAGSNAITATAHDAAGNIAIANTSIVLDITGPTVTVEQGTPDPTTDSTINFTVAFNETVTDFAAEDVTLRGTAGATTAVITGAGTVYNVAVSGMTGNGTVVATVTAGKAHDAAGNANAASTSTDNSVTYNLAAQGAQTWYINGDRDSSAYMSLTTNPASIAYDQPTYAWGFQYYLSSPTPVTFPAGNWTVHFTVLTPIVRNINVGILRQDAATGWSQRVMASTSYAINNNTPNGTTSVDVTFALPEFTLTPSGATPGYLGMYWGAARSDSMTLKYGGLNSYLITPPGSPIVACPPYITGMSATGVDSDSANLSTTVAYMGSYPSAVVDFVGQVYASGTPASVTSAGTLVTGTATGLSPSTYYYSYPRLTYGNNYRSYGKSVEFTTAAAPALVTLASLAIEQLDPTIPSAGQTRQFKATGTYSDLSTSDLTNQVTWTIDSADTAVATINTNGLARSLTAGTAHINASITLNGTTKTAPSAVLTVAGAILDRLVISPVDPTVTFIARNAPTIQFTATAVMTDGTTQIVTNATTWTESTTSAIATITTGGTARGLATTVSAGNSTIHASYTLNTVTRTADSVLHVLADTVAPLVVLDYPANGSTLNAADMIITGHLNDAKATVTIIVNGTPLAPAANVDLDTGEFIYAITLRPGNNSIRAKAVDGAGNIGMSSTAEVKFEAIPAVISITSPGDLFTTNTPALTVTGTAVGTSEVVVRLNGANLTPAAVIGGTWSKEITLLAGENIITGLSYNTATPPAVNGTSGTVTVMLDSTAPVVTLDTPTGDAIFNTPNINVSGSVDDPGVTSVSLKHYQGASFASATSVTYPAIAVTSGHFSFNITLATGKNWFDITAADLPGNSSTTSAIMVTLDNSVPRVTLTNPARTRTLTNSTGLIVTGTIDDLSISSATLVLRGTVQTPAFSVLPDGTFSVPVTLNAGANTIEVRATDGVNNGTSGVYTVTVDTTAPVLTVGVSEPIDSVIINVSSNEALTASPVVTIDDGVNPIATVTMTRAGINNWVGFFSDVSGTVLPGDYIATIVGTDAAGNAATRTATFSKESVAITPDSSVVVADSSTTLTIDSTSANLGVTEISVTQHINNPSGLVEHPTGAPNAGVFVDISAPSEFRDALENENLSLVVTVTYNPAELPAGTDESTLKLYSWSTNLGIWEEVAGCVVNTTAHTITGTLLHLSTYGIFGSETVVTPPAAGSGGGGGGGGGGDKTMLTSGLTADTPLLLNAENKTINSARLATADGKAALLFTPGTAIMNASGNALSILTASVVSKPPIAPDQNALVSAYSFGPAGSQFNPAITLSMSYDPAKLPADVVESNLYIGYYSGTTWVKLESTVDPVTKTVNAKVSHFSTYALIGKAGPAAVIIPTPTPTVPAEPTPVITPEPTPTATTPAVVVPTVQPTTPAATATPVPTVTKTTAAPTKTTTPPGKSSSGTVIFVIVGAIVVMGAVMTVLFIRRRGAKA